MTDIEPKLCWIDLETTGLDANEEVPLELALAISDESGRVLDVFSTLVHDETSEYNERITAAKKHEFVGTMHESSGLWDELDNREVHGYRTLHNADKAAVAWLDKLGVPKLPLAGSSIGSLDRPFVLRHFPLLNARLHYRNIDVSTLKELCKVLNPSLYEKMQAEYAKEHKESHRAVDDIFDSIAEYVSYIDNFLFVEDE